MLLPMTMRILHAVWRIKLAELYVRRPDTARGRAEVERVADAILEARDRLVVAERALLAEHGQTGAAGDRANGPAGLGGDCRFSTCDHRYRFRDLCISPSLGKDLGRSTAADPGSSASCGSRGPRSIILPLRREIAMGDDVLQQIVGHGLGGLASSNQLGREF